MSRSLPTKIDWLPVKLLEGGGKHESEHTRERRGSIGKLVD
jgi:hypothetical protein